jgi:IS30 family transposase
MGPLGSQNKCNTCYGVVAMGQCYCQLSLEERIEIYRLHAAGESMQMIARSLNRHVSTISREIDRNGLATKVWPADMRLRELRNWLSAEGAGMVASSWRASRTCKIW